MRLIFLDLDKTLLGEDYSPEPGRKIVRALVEAGFEVVLNSSKTRAEQEYYRKAWNLSSPFIVENGSAVYIPEGYFPSDIVGNSGIKREDYHVIEFGMPYSEIRSALDELAGKYGLKYYGNSSLEEVVGFTGLPGGLARLAMKREYSETLFRWERRGFEAELEAEGFRVLQGSRFINVIGETDKGKAARELLGLYSLMEPVESFAAGDGPNDFPLFDVVDHAYLVGDLRHPKAKNISSVEEILGVIK